MLTNTIHSQTSRIKLQKNIGLAIKLKNLIKILFH